MKRINTLSVFSGGGGLDLGFAAANFRIILSTDKDHHSCKTLEGNHFKMAYYKSHPVICTDVSKLTKDRINKETRGARIDFIVGGPPCQSFSVFGRRQGLDDPRGNLIFQYSRLINDVKPRGFVFENVYGLKTINGGATFSEFLEQLTFKGSYRVSVHEYDMANFGVPQFRKRLFIVGNKDGVEIPPMETTHSETRTLLSNGHEPFMTAGLAISGMPEPVTDWNAVPWVNGHVGRKHSNRIVDRYSSLKYGERDPKTRINKLNPEKPSFAIIVGSDKGGGKGHVHPFSPREVTPRESARLQTFPDWWTFSGTGRHVIRQVGNAVPPLFAAQFGAHIANCLFGKKNFTDWKYFIRKLQLDYLNR